MELFFNYLFAILQPFSKDGWRIISLISLFFFFKNWNSWKKDKLILSILLFLAYGTIISFFSEYKSDSFKDMSNYFVGWFLSFLMGYAVTETKDKLKLLKCYVFVFMFTLFLGFLAYFHIIPRRIGFLHLIEYGRLIVFDGGPELGARCNFVIIPCLVLLLFYKNIKQNIIISLIALYFTYALLLSGTRNCYISLFLTFLFIFFFYMYKRKTVFKGICILSVLILCFTATYLFNANIKKRISNTNLKTESSIVERLEIYKFGLQLLKEKPIFGHIPKVAIHRQENINSLPHFHDIYLNTFVDFGIIGLILFLIIIYNIFKRLIILYMILLKVIV